MEWFRYYYEARTDKKLATLSDAEHRVWSDLLCYAAEQRVGRGTIPPMELDLLAIECARGDADLLTATIARLVKLKIVAVDEAGSITFINFEKRQHDKPSDAPAATAARKAAQRLREREARDAAGLEGYVTPMSRDIPPQSRDVTRRHALDTDSDTDSDTDRVNTPLPPAPIGAEAPAAPAREPKYPPPFEAFWRAYPRKENKPEAYRAWRQLRPDGETVDAMLAGVRRWERSDMWARKVYPHASTWLRGRQWEDEPLMAPEAVAARASPNGRGPGKLDIIRAGLGLAAGETTDDGDGLESGFGGPVYDVAPSGHGRRDGPGADRALPRGAG